MAHLIFVCKYRKQLMTKFGDEIKAIMYAVAEDDDIGILEMETDKDHVHILISYSPTKSILEIVRLFKQRVTNVNKVHMQSTPINTQHIEFGGRTTTRNS